MRNFVPSAMCAVEHCVVSCVASEESPDMKSRCGIFFASGQEDFTTRCYNQCTRSMCRTAGRTGGCNEGIRRSQKAMDDG